MANHKKHNRKQTTIPGQSATPTDAEALPPPESQNIESITVDIANNVIDKVINKINKIAINNTARYKDMINIIITSKIIKSFGPFYCGITVSYKDKDENDIEYNISHRDLMYLIDIVKLKQKKPDEDNDATDYKKLLHKESEKINRIITTKKNQLHSISTEYDDYPQLTVIPNRANSSIEDWLKTSDYFRIHRKPDNSNNSKKDKKTQTDHTTQFDHTIQTPITPHIWWVEINGRLLSITNNKYKNGKISYEYQYYICDHGEMLDIQWQQAGILFSNRYRDAKSTRTKLKSLQENKTIICNTVHELMNAIPSAPTVNTGSSNNSTLLKQLQTFLKSLQKHENMIFKTANKIKNLSDEGIAQILKPLLQKLQDAENKHKIILAVYDFMKDKTSYSFTAIEDNKTKKYCNSLLSHIDGICDTTHAFMKLYPVVISKKLDENIVRLLNTLINKIKTTNTTVNEFIKSNFLQTYDSFITYYELVTGTDSNQDAANTIIKNWATRKINRLDNNFANQKKEVIDTLTFALLPISRSIINQSSKQANAKSLKKLLAQSKKFSRTISKTNNLTKKLKKPLKKAISRKKLLHIRELAKLIQIMQEGIQPIETFLYRPLSAYYTLDGAPYHEFCDSVIEYINSENKKDPKNTNEVTSKNLVTMMRSILENKQDGNIPPFLPNLVGSWFLSETARYHESYISSLLIMDMIENPWDYTEDSTPSEHCYTWKNTLVHPMDDMHLPSNLEERMYKMGGRHPMASSKTSHTTGENAFKDNLIKQKEHSLLVHWVYKCLKHLTKNTSITIALKSIINDAWQIHANGTMTNATWTPTSNSQIKKDKKEGNKWWFIEKTIQPLLAWRCKRVDSIADFLNAHVLNILPSIEILPITSTNLFPNGHLNATNEIAEPKNDGTPQLMFLECKKRNK